MLSVTKKKIILFLAIFAISTFMLTFTMDAYAQEGADPVPAEAEAAEAEAASPGVSGDGRTLGTLINNTVKSMQDTPGLLTGLSYLFGLILGFMGVMKLKDHVENPNQVQIWDPMKRFLAGGAFFALPFVIRAAQDTISIGMDILQGTNYNTSGVSGTGLDAMIVRLMSDIWIPMQYAFIGFCYLAGVVLIIIGISRLLKTEQEGPRGPLGIGTVMTFLVGGALLSLNKTLAAAVFSIFNTDATNNAALQYTAGMDKAAIGHANAVIGAIMAFVAVLGWISFIRGFFIMRGVAEGNSQASAMAGITHILGGAVAINLGGFISAVQNTLQIANFGLKFSSAEPYITSVTFFA
mgnify:CR=1 FL=1